MLAGFIPIYHIPPYFQFTPGDSPLTSALRATSSHHTCQFQTILVKWKPTVKGRGYDQPLGILGGSHLALAGSAVLCEPLVLESTCAAAYISSDRYSYQRPNR